jgi:uncharacterized protein (DUF1697 family)
MRYVAFLRAVNVGKRIVKMRDLKVAFESIPLTNVETFIASGNVVFDASGRNVAALERKIEAKLRDVFGFEIETFVRSVAEVRRIAECGPYREALTDGRGHIIYIGFIRDAPPADAHRQVKALCTDAHDFRIDGREVFWLRRDRSADLKAGGPGIETIVKSRVTFRNATTVRRLAHKYGGDVRG